jgi:membrane protease YdiL (CAAX protease family)
MLAVTTADREFPPTGVIRRRLRMRSIGGPLLCVAVLIGVEVTLIAPGHVLAGDIVEAALLFVFLQVGAGLGGAWAQSRAAKAAILGLVLVPLSRVVALGLPLREGSYPAGLLAIALLVGYAAWTLAPTVGVIRRSFVGLRSPLSHLRAAFAGLALGLVAYLLGAPVLWPAGAHGDRVLLGVVAVACAVLVEELVFRGVIQLTLQRVAGRVGVIAAIALYTSTYLASDSASLVLTQALAGAVFAYTVERTGTLGGPMAGHLLLALGAGGIWPVLLGRVHPHWLSGPGSTVGLAVATASMTAILLYRPLGTASARAIGR